MSHEPAPPHLTPSDDRVDLALAWLTRFVAAHDWSPLVAARRLIMCMDGDLGVLRSTRAHVAHALSVRPTTSASRALATLDVAIAERVSANEAVAMIEGDGGIPSPSRGFRHLEGRDRMTSAP